MFQVSWGTMFYLYNMLIIITLMSTTIIKYSDEGRFLSEKVMLHIISFSILKWLFHVQKLFSEAFIYRSGYLLLEMHLSVFLLLCELEGTKFILSPPRTIKIKIISIIFYLRSSALQSTFGLQCTTFSKSPSTCNTHLLATSVSMN